MMFDSSEGRLLHGDMVKGMMMKETRYEGNL